MATSFFFLDLFGAGEGAPSSIGTTLGADFGAVAIVIPLFGHSANASCFQVLRSSSSGSWCTDIVVGVQDKFLSGCV
jgi:hypothetical protein